MARILAKAFNCHGSDKGDPCGECNVCKAIDGTGDCLDVVEIDGASHNRVENVRDLIENLRFRPVESRYRIYIVDEVHMLSTAAFNALLKTLEEPPEHAKFILATTEPLKVPETIRSRCQMFDFRRLTADVIGKHIAQICESEKVPVEQGLLDRIARHANGGMRDAMTLLDQLITFGEGTPTVDDFERLTGRLPPELLEEVVRASLAGEVDGVVQAAADALGRGARPADLISQLIELMEGVLVTCAGGEPADRTPEERETLKQLGAAASVDHVMAMLDVLVEATERLKRRHDGRLVVEMALITLARLQQLQPVADVLASGGLAAQPSSAAPQPRVRPASKGTASTGKAAAPKPAPAKAAPAPAAREQNAWGEESAATARSPAPSEPVPAPAPAAPAAPAAQPAAHDASPEPSAPASFRDRFIEALPSRSLRMDMERYGGIGINGDALVIQLPDDGPSPLYDPTSDKQLAKQLAEVGSRIEGRTLHLKLLKKSAGPAASAGSAGGSGGARAGGKASGAGAPASSEGTIGQGIEQQWPGAERVDF